MASVMDGAGRPGDYGRGNQDAKVNAGNGKVSTPTTSHDIRDHGAKPRPIQAIRETPPVRAGRGNHDSSLLGG